MDKNKIIALVVGVILVGVGSFYAGTKYAGSASAQSGNGARTFQRGSGSANRPGAGGVAAGDIIAEDNQSVTLRLRDGSSLIVFYSPSTKVMKSTEGSMTDLVTGASIMIQGTQNSDGSITAQSIQVRPASQQNASGGGR